MVNSLITDGISVVTNAWCYNSRCGHMKYTCMPVFIESAQSHIF